MKARFFNSNHEFIRAELQTGDTVLYKQNGGPAFWCIITKFTEHRCSIVPLQGGKSRSCFPTFLAACRNGERIESGLSNAELNSHE